MWQIFLKVSLKFSVRKSTSRIFMPNEIINTSWIVFVINLIASAMSTINSMTLLLEFFTLFTIYVFFKNVSKKRLKYFSKVLLKIRVRKSTFRIFIFKAIIIAS